MGRDSFSRMGNRVIAMCEEMRKMGAFEQEIRKIVGELADNELLDKTVEEILNAHCNIYALYAMSQLMSAQESVTEMAKKRKTDRFQFFQGKVESYQEFFVKVAFDGLSVEDGTMTQDMLENAKVFWQQKVHDFMEQALLPSGG